MDWYRPRILGVLLDAVARGLAMQAQTRLDKLPRMADFALWATACETAFWPAGTFWSAYCGNRDEAVEGVIDADPIAAAVRGVMTRRTEWTGTASELLVALAHAAGERVARSSAPPDDAGDLPSASSASPSNSDAGTSADGADAKTPQQSAPGTAGAQRWRWRL